MQRVNRLRQQLPAVYNCARVHELPIPPVETVETVEELAGGDDQNESDTASNLSEEEIATIEHVEVDEGGDNSAAETSTELNENGIAINSSQIDTKPVLLIDGDDLAAFDNLFDYNGQSSTDNEVDPISLNIHENVNASANESGIENEERGLIENTHETDDVVDTENEESAANDELNSAENNDAEAREAEIAANVQIVLMYGENVVIDEDLEYIHIPGQILQAMQSEPEYKTKSNDALCGNRPFKETVNGDRAFLVPNGNDNGFIEVWLTAHAAIGLVKMNKKRTGQQYDTVFLKALLIGFCTIKKIKEAEPIDDGILALIKGKLEK